MGGSYNHDMERILEFSNPKNVFVLCNYLGVSDALNCSAMRGLYRYSNGCINDHSGLFDMVIDIYNYMY